MSKPPKGTANTFYLTNFMKNIKKETTILMYDNDPVTFLNLRRLPGRVDYHGAGVLFHYEIAAVRALVEMGYLKPLGDPGSAEHKYFLSKTIEKLAADERWMDKTTRALRQYWAKKNARRKKVEPPLADAA
jgi:hypothetical protein